MTTFDVSALVALRRVESIALAPDETWLAVAVQRLDEEHGSKYVGDLWRVPLDGSGATQLTRGKWNDRAPAFLADGSLAFLSNRPTSEKSEQDDKRSQVFALPAAGGEPRCLTDEPLGVSSFATARHADVFCVQTSLLPGVELEKQRARAKELAEHGPSAIVYAEMPVRHWDQWLPEREAHLVVYRGGERAVQIAPQPGVLARELLWDLAADGAFVVTFGIVIAGDRMADYDVSVVDTTRGERRRLFRTERAWLGAPVISPDGRRFATIRHTRLTGSYGAPEVIVVDVAAGAIHAVPPSLDTGFAPVGWTHDSAKLVCVAPLQTHYVPFVVDPMSGEPKRVVDVRAGGTHVGNVVGREAIFGVRSDVVTPPEAYRCALGGGEPAVLTSLSGFARVEDVEVEDHEVVSTDGTPVQYRVVKPAGSQPRTCVMFIHGGPISDWGDVWHWRWCSLVLAKAGHAVALPNPRGSVGFGQEFIEGIWNNEWGGQCYEDLMAVADELEARPDVRDMVAMGGSFGGYMTNWIGTQTDRFRCLITHASIFDNAAFHGVTDLPAFWAHQFGADPYRDRGSFDRYSPIAHVGNWRSPTLVIHGDRDYRVPIGEALALFEALQHHGVTSKLLVFPDENHWILKPRNIVRWYEAVVEFIGSHTGSA